MNFATELIKLFPRKFRVQPVWQELFQAFGEVLDEVHAKIDGLQDLNDPEEVPVGYMQYLARNTGVPLPATFGTVDEYRRRWFLRSIPYIIKGKGTLALIEDLARFLFFFTFPTSEVEVYEQWSNDYANFYYPPPVISEVPTGWVGNGVQVAFSGTLASPPVRVRSVHVTTVDAADALLEAWDDDQGAMQGDVVAGSITHATGAITVTFDAPPKSGANVTVVYTIEDGQYLTPHYVVAFPTDIYLEMGLDPVSYVPVGWVGNGVQTNFTATAGKIPIKEGTVRITAVDTADNPMEVTDDGAGNLVGDVGAGANTVDYATGAIDVTFNAAVKSGEDATLAYDHKNIYLGRQRVDEMLAYLDRFRPAHTVYTVDLGVATDFWRVEAQRWRVGTFNDPVLPAPTNDEIIRVGRPAWL